MQQRTLSKFLLRFTVVLAIVSALFLWGCDDDNFEDVDASEIQGNTYLFTDARAFRLPAQSATLSIGIFGTPGLQSDQAAFTLTSGAFTATGVLDLDNADVPIGSRRSDCDFRVDASTFNVDGLRPGDTIDTECRLTTVDETELQIANNATEQVSTGTRQ